MLAIIFIIPRKGRGTRDEIANILWVIQKAVNSRKWFTSLSLTMIKPLPVWVSETVDNSQRDVYSWPHYLAPVKPVCRPRSNRIRQEQWTCSELVKEYIKAVLLSPHLFNLHAEYIMQNVRLDEGQAGIKLSGGNINKLRHADDRKQKDN